MTVRRAVPDAGTVPPVIAPTGGELDQDGEPVTVPCTFATARSTAFDAILPAGAPAPGVAPAPGAHGARDGEGVAEVDDEVVAEVVVTAGADRHPRPSPPTGPAAATVPLYGLRGSTRAKPVEWAPHSRERPSRSRCGPLRCAVALTPRARRT